VRSAAYDPDPRGGGMKEHGSDRRGRYIGRASRKEGSPTLEKALIDAYERAIGSKPPEDRQRFNAEPLTFRFKVVGIRIEGTNPPSDYIVDLDDD
jgi:hypothetical protein